MKQRKLIYSAIVICGLTVGSDALSYVTNDTIGIAITDRPLKEIKTESDKVSKFHKWGFIGDSLSSGTLTTYEDGKCIHTDHYEISWGQKMCQALDIEGINFSMGGG